MKKIKILVSFIVMGLALSSCDTYLDINENPNSIHQENLTPQLIFPGAVTQIYRTQARDMMQFGNIMMNSWAGNSYAYGGPFASEYTLASVNSSFYDTIWDGIYPNLANFVYIEKYANADHSQDYYVAAAKVMKAYYMQYIVDLYGDAPYSAAFQGQTNLTPKYDDDVAIYKSLIKDMDEAMLLIENGQASSTYTPIALGTTDIVFAGNMDKWSRFANTVKLRLLMRMSNVTGDLATYRDQQMATVAAKNILTENVFEKPGYASSSDDALNPLVLNLFYNSAGAEAQNKVLMTASEHMATVLNGNNLGLTNAFYQKFNGIVDPRRSRIFTLVTYNGTVVKGIRQGATPGQPGAPNDNSTVSGLSPYYVGSTTLTNKSTLMSAGNARGGLLMSLAEINFLKAEAALRYPGIFSSWNAQQSFESGITESATVMNANAPLSTIAAYITSISAKPGLGWAGSTDQKYEAIMTQKWILLTHYNPTEMYIEYNRMQQQYPYSPMATTSIRANKPWRLIYPTSEYVGNSANVPNISSSEVFTKNNKTPFWNQN
ncbi:SusD/RagB family nutrient-binding outer membrane lipoprotein [Chryseobacterium sp.]|uniref:SusD/RagB family nutrient-binding outer membrane lipoprotein n=1 Tax=Chryseobacterium sp. TaxID=1871047 RepID=UPI002637D716|nr:SusD/RagB family nutrient-binding outer membrane lipoprotein [Chryseobacterium sp.]